MPEHIDRTTNWRWFRKTFLADKGTYPIIIVIGGAACIAGLGLYHMFTHPGHIADRKPGVYVDEDYRAASKYYDHALRRYAVAHKGNDVIPSLNRWAAKRLKPIPEPSMELSNLYEECESQEELNELFERVAGPGHENLNYKHIRP
jgi:hypothetical protein